MHQEQKSIWLMAVKAVNPKIRHLLSVWKRLGKVLDGVVLLQK